MEPCPDPDTAVMWFRRDLRLADNPALLDACAADGVLPLFVLDPAAVGPGGADPPCLPRSRQPPRPSTRSLRQRHTHACRCVRGDPVDEVLLAARAVGASRVHVAADYGPYGHRRRPRRSSRRWPRTASTWCAPARRTPWRPAASRTARVTAYKVYTPFSRAWTEHGWRGPVEAPTGAHWLSLDDTVELPDPQLPDGLGCPRPASARRCAGGRRTSTDGLDDYDSERDRPDLDATSHMSVHLKWGEIHPRTMLADLAGDRRAAVSTFRKELAWREFYADVLFQRPETAREYLRGEFARMEYDEPGERLDAWRRGRTGYPIVDAGMRQLRATGWMHNRVRMIVASFLVKDLHVEWQHGARHFMHWLVDGDLAVQPARLAVGGRLRHRRLAVLPGLQPRDAGPEVRPRRRPTSGGGCPSWPTSTPDHVHDAVDRRRTARPTATPTPIVDHAEERREALDRLERIKK